MIPVTSGANPCALPRAADDEVMMMMMIMMMKILMTRSPDPINWTVPLDTGKTFQVTQCVRDTGELMMMIMIIIMNMMKKTSINIVLFLKLEETVSKTFT